MANILVNGANSSGTCLVEELRRFKFRLYKAVVKERSCWKGETTAIHSYVFDE
jgi:hypothetical protein